MQDISHIYFRPELNDYPNIQLPIFPRSIGMFVQPPFKQEIVTKGEKTFVQLFWMVSGSMELDFCGETQKLSQGDVIYTLPLEAYTIRVSGEGCCYRWITFDGPDAEKFMLSFGYPKAAFHAGDCPIQQFVNFEEHLLLRTPYSWRRMFCEICNILTIAGGSLDSPDTGTQKFYEILIFCRDHLADIDLNVNTLSEEFHLNRSTLLRLFREKTNASPSEYLCMLRLQKALSMLNNPRLTINEIAAQCGFNDANYFCRFFKKRTGKRPSQMR